MQRAEKVAFFSGFAAFGFRARFLRFWTRSEVLLNVPDEVTPKFSARAPGARELEFIWS